MCEERDKLTQELKRTPELIEKTLADLKEKCEYSYNSQHLITMYYLFICWVAVVLHFNALHFSFVHLPQMRAT